MKTILCKVTEIEDKLENLSKDDIGEVRVIVEDINRKVSPYVSELIIKFPSMGVSVRLGTLYICDEDDGGICPDNSFTLVYELNEYDPDNFIYWSDYDLPKALFQYFDSKYSMEDICNTDCVIEY